MRAWVVIAVVVVAVQAPGVGAQASIEIAKVLAAEAHEAAGEGRWEVAAGRYDQAAAIDAHGLWVGAAAEAWMKAGRPELAGARWKTLLGDAALGEEAARQGLLVDALERETGRAERAAAQGRWKAAAKAWEAAFERFACGRFAFEAARALERHGQLGDARRWFGVVADRDDVTPEMRAAALDGMTRIGIVAPPAPSTARAWPWALVASGGVIVVGSVVAFAIADDERRAVRAAQADGVVVDMTRAAALAHESRMNDWSTAGWVAGGVGLALLGVGLGFVVDDMALAVGPNHDGFVAELRWSR